MRERALTVIYSWIEGHAIPRERDLKIEERKTESERERETAREREMVRERDG